MTSTSLSPAYAAGHERGVACATWVVIGDENLSARAILDGIADGDPEVMDMCPSPLSGEWAGESIPELSAEYGLSLSDDEVASEFEAGFSDGFFTELERRCTALLPTAADLFSEAGFTGYRWHYGPTEDSPEGGESAYLSNFTTYGAPTHFEMPVTLWGDYCGDDCGRSNYRSLLRDYPDTFVAVSGDYFSRMLLIPVSVSVEVAESLIEIGTGLAEDYPLYDDEDHSALETEESEAAWDAYVSFDLRRAIANQLEHTLTDPYAVDVDAIDEDDLRERFYAAVWSQDSGPHFESATSIVFPYWDDIVAELAEHYGASQPQAIKETRRCFCPDDCDCHKPWRVAICGCKQH